MMWTGEPAEEWVGAERWEIALLGAASIIVAGFIIALLYRN